MKITTILYATEVGTDLKCAPGVRVGDESDEPHKAEGVKKSGASKEQVSTISFAADWLLTELSERSDFSIAGLKTGTCITLGENIFILTDHMTLYGTGTPTGRIISVLLLAQSIARKADKDFTRYLWDLFDSYDENPKGNYKDIMFSLSDCYYHNIYKPMSETNIRSQKIVREEAESFIRSSNPQPIPYLDRFPLPSFANTGKGQNKKKEEVGLDRILEKCKAGEYLVDHEWDDTQTDYIQPLTTLDGYIPTEEFRAILNKIDFRTKKVLTRMHERDMKNSTARLEAIGQDYINLTLSGKPGSGKTKLAYAIAAATGLPIYTISNSHNTDEDEYEGKTKMIDGKPVSVETDTVRCVEHGGILLLEEINLVNAAVAMGALGQLVEFPFILKKFGYQTIRRHPLCIVISTMNRGTAGSKSMSQPFANRFKQSFAIEDPSEDDFIRILTNTGAGNKVCRWVYDCYRRITACVEEDDGMADTESILLSLSLRSCIGAIENIQEGMDARPAVERSIIGKIAEQDADVADHCRKVLDAMREPFF